MITTETVDNCTIFRITGKVTASDIILAATAYRSGEQTPTTLWDFSQAEQVQTTTLEMKGIADSLKAVAVDKSPRRPAKVALVGARSTNIGLGKIFAAFAGMAGLPYDYKVFRQLSPAVEWLRLPSANDPSGRR